MKMVDKSHTKKMIDYGIAQTLYSDHCELPCWYKSNKYLLGNLYLRILGSMLILPILD